MIKIEPFLATDSTQIKALLRYQDEPVPYEAFCSEEMLFNSGFLFWQHWLPCRYHLAPTVYVAKEGAIILGLISVSSCSKTNSCWAINHLVIHPVHRRRGIAQKLLQYVFALLGSQGVSHFIAEISCQNSPAISLLGDLGFKRAARLTCYQIPSDWNVSTNIEEEESIFRWAQADDQKSLFQLVQDALPVDLRLVYSRCVEDFILKTPPDDAWNCTIKRLTKFKNWYWVAEDKNRQTIFAAIKVSAHRQGDFHFEFIIHPGWQHMTGPAANFALKAMARLNMKGMITAKVYDYQTGLSEALTQTGWQSNGEFMLMTREHWLRAKKSQVIKLDGTVKIPSIGKPAINLPYNYNANKLLRLDKNYPKTRHTLKYPFA